MPVFSRDTSSNRPGLWYRGRFEYVFSAHRSATRSYEDLTTLTFLSQPVNGLGKKRDVRSIDSAVPFN
jgi:hypothetical protein